MSRALSLPNPRYRIYGGLHNYISLFYDLFTGGRTKGEGDIRQLEKQLSEYLNVKHVLCVPQNRVGVYLTLKSILNPGQGVIMSPYTIADIINMVILAGGRPIFADVERETCNIDPKEVELLLGQNDNVGAVLVTHLHGLANDPHRIKELCEQRGIPLIEDAAQGFGAEENGKKLGTIGQAGVFSFGMFKNISTWFGGAVVTDDTQLYNKISHELDKYQYQGWKFILKKVKKGLLSDIATFPALFKACTFWIFRYGFLNDIESINKLVRTELDTNRKEKIPEEYLARLTPAQARLGLHQIGAIDEHSRIRIENAKIYYEGLKDIDELIIPPLRTDGSHIYTYFPVQYHPREKLLKFLMKHNRDIAAQHYKNCADLPGFSEFHRECPRATQVAESLIFLPTYPRYGEGQVRANVAVIRAFFGKS